jgi:oligopeptide transport system substrate-binding protein
VKLDEIHFHATDDLDVQERMFRTGALHRTSELPLTKIPVYRKEHAEAFREDPHYGVYFFRLNTTRPPLNDVRVRRALSLAIDREAIVTHVTRGGQQPARNYCPPSEKFTSRVRLDGNLETARRLLAEAGFPGGRGFPRLEVLYNTSDTHRIIMETIQQMWQRELGISVTITNQEWKVYLDAIQRLNYDLARGGWIANYPDPHTFFDVFASGSGNNNTGFANADYDRLLASALRASNETERMAIYERLDEILAREVPVVPIYFYTRVYALSPHVTGWPVNLLDNHAWKHVGLK